MHRGTFPPVAGSSAAGEGYSRGPWGPAELDPPGGSSRRHWLAGVGGLVVGAALSWSWAGASSTAAEQPGPRSDAAPRRGTPEWALDLLDADPDTLIRWSGDLARTAARFRTDERLVPCFERLLDVVLERRGEDVDVAGASAVLGLAQLGRADLVSSRLRGILGRRDLTETRAAAEKILAADGRLPDRGDGK